MRAGGRPRGPGVRTPGVWAVAPRRQRGGMAQGREAGTVPRNLDFRLLGIPSESESQDRALGIA